ncbi:MAG: MerR family transcriptional regulator [Firmicutes bacterium]|jgi:MerR family glutamine synthetase transcriptional repressor|nr:MerR family transcriptional regulator [Bacillota bacterium]MDH7495420.1 MerR family transcriptional regulator [Bacillota bacterium]
MIRPGDRRTDEGGWYIMAVSRDAPIYTIGAVRRLTGLTDRQIRYYDETGLVVPARTPGNQRLYSEADVDALREVKRLLGQGRRIEEVRSMLSLRQRSQPASLGELMKSSDAAMRFGGPVSLRSVYPLADRPELLRTIDIRRNPAPSRKAPTRDE